MIPIFQQIILAIFCTFYWYLIFKSADHNAFKKSKLYNRIGKILVFHTWLGYLIWRTFFIGKENPWKYSMQTLNHWRLNATEKNIQISHMIWLSIITTSLFYFYIKILIIFI